MSGRHGSVLDRLAPRRGDMQTLAWRQGSAHDSVEPVAPEAHGSTGDDMLVTVVSITTMIAVA